MIECLGKQTGDDLCGFVLCKRCLDIRIERRETSQLDRIEECQERILHDLHCLNGKCFYLGAISRIMKDTEDKIDKLLSESTAEQRVRLHSEHMESKQ